jgi:hypothetical protein
MRTVAQILANGINKVQDLQESLGMAAKLEFATIPPYLCAEWSIKAAEDPDHVARMLRNVVMQEMLHMGLALNMLAAIGGKPAIANKDFVPIYPTDGLPGNVHPHLVVDLLPFGTAALNAFLQIEFPEGGPIALEALEIFPTIGDFYDAISNAFQALQPAIGSAPQVEANVGVGDDAVFKITAVADAQKAIEEIKEQGEGTSVSPFQGSFDPSTSAHYYVFRQIQLGHELQKGADGGWHPTGPAIRMPGVTPFTRSGDPHASDDFNVALSDLLRLMQQAWTTGPATIDDAVGQMRVLRKKGTTLIAAGVCPEFRWTDATSLH